MAKIERQQRGFVFTGWHMLAIMVAFFGTIISVNMFMAWNAVSSWSGLVVKNTYVASQEFNAKVAAAEVLAASGIEGELSIAGETVTYQLKDKAGEPLYADEVVAVFKRPVDESKDFTLTLAGVRPGVFSAQQVLPVGQWIIDISSSRDGEKVFHQTLRTVVSGSLQ